MIPPLHEKLGTPVNRPDGMFGDTDRSPGIQGKKGEGGNTTSEGDDHRDNCVIEISETDRTFPCLPAILALNLPTTRIP